MSCGGVCLVLRPDENQHYDYWRIVLAVPCAGSFNLASHYGSGRVGLIEHQSFAGKRCLRISRKHQALFSKFTGEESHDSNAVHPAQLNP